MTLAVESGMVVERGPDVRTMTMRTGLGADGRRGGVQELSHVGGVVRDEDGEPVADAWVAVPDLGRMTTSNADGRFRIPRRGGRDLRGAGARRDGPRGEAEVTVPSGMLDVVGAARRPSARAVERAAPNSARSAARPTLVAVRRAHRELRSTAR